MTTQTHSTPTQILSFFVLGTFLTFILFLGIAQQFDGGRTNANGRVASPGASVPLKGVLKSCSSCLSRQVLTAESRETGLGSIRLETNID